MNPREIFHGLWRLRDRDLGLVVSLLASHTIDVEKAPEKAINWCMEHAKAGEPQAQHALAKLLWIGLGGERDDRAAFEWCTKASEQGYVPATVMLSGFYSTGIGIAVDYIRSIALLETASARGSPEAMSLLGASYEFGLGVEKDHSRAIELWRSAAELNNADAQYNLGAELTNSAEPNEMSEGVRWLRAAAEQGHYSAHYALADLYDNGKAGLPKSERLAREHRAQGAKLSGSG